MHSPRGKSTDSAQPDRWSDGASSSLLRRAAADHTPPPSDPPPSAHPLPGTMENGPWFAGARTTYPSPPMTCSSSVQRHGRSLSGGMLSSVNESSRSPPSWHTDGSTLSPRVQHPYRPSTGSSFRSLDASPHLPSLASIHPHPSYYHERARESESGSAPAQPRLAEGRAPERSVGVAPRGTPQWSELEQRAYALGFSHGLDVRHLSTPRSPSPTASPRRPFSSDGDGPGANALQHTVRGWTEPGRPLLPTRAQSDPLLDAARPGILVPITALVGSPRPEARAANFEPQNPQAAAGHVGEVPGPRSPLHRPRPHLGAGLHPTSAANGQHHLTLIHPHPQGQPHASLLGSVQGPGWAASNARLAISCYPCREKKLKCDGDTPCDPCVRKGNQHNCAYATEVRRRGKTQKRRRTRETPRRDWGGGGVNA